MSSSLMSLTIQAMSCQLLFSDIEFVRFRMPPVLAGTIF